MKTLLRSLLLFTTLVVLFGSASAISVVSRQNGNWSSPSTWMNGQVPGAGDEVNIQNNNQITVDVAVSCYKVTINTGCKLTVNAALTLSGDMYANTSTWLTTNAPLNVGGNLVLDNGSITVINSNAKLTVSGDMTLNASSTLTHSSEIAVTNKLTINSGAVHTMYADMSVSELLLNAQSTITLNCNTLTITNRRSNNPVYMYNTTAVFNNTCCGTLKFTNGGQVRANSYVNLGHVVVENVNIDLGQNLNEYGNIGFECGREYNNLGTISLYAPNECQNGNRIYTDITLTNTIVDFGTCAVLNGTLRLNSGGDVINNTITYGNNAKLAFNRSYSLSSSSKVWPTGTGSNVPPSIDVISGTITVADSVTVKKRLNLLGGTLGAKVRLTNDTVYYCGGSFASTPNYGSNVTIMSCSTTVISVSSQTNVTCYGASTGAVTLSATGGTSPYTWSKDGVNYQSNATFSGLAAGSYTFRSKDANGIITTKSVSITQPSSGITPDVASQTNINCANPTGSVTMTATGGSGSYTWSKDGTNFQSSATFSGLAAGNYTITAKDGSGCTATKAVSISQQLTASASVSVASQTNVTCYGVASGSVTLSASGGTAPYTWSKDGSNFQSSATFSGLAAGNYTFTCKDANSCTVTKAVSITQPAAAIAASVASQTNVSCNGQANGSVTLSATGGTSPYTWSQDGTTFQSSATFSGLTGGSYTFTCKDANGCTSTLNATITQPAVLVASATVTNVTANGGTNGAATAVVSGGTSPFTYAWGTGATTASISNVPAGVYYLLVTDSKGCTDDYEAAIAQPAASCSGFRTQTQGGWGANPSGNNPAVYLTNNFAGAFPSGLTIGCTNTLKLTTAQAVINFLPSGGTAAALPSGNLQNPASYSNVLAGQLVAATLNVKFDQYDASFGSSTVLLANAVMNGGTFDGWTVQQVIDEANKKIGGCTSSYTFSQLNTALTAINESFDNGTCTGSNLICCAVSVAVSSQTNVYAYGASTGSVTLSATNGTAPYTYSKNGTTFQSSATFSGLAAGTYTFTAKDANGCTAVKSATITQPAAALALNVSSQSNVTVNGGTNGSVTLVANGGTSPYTYSKDGTNFQSSATFSGLAAGTYTFTVKDVNGITATKSVTVTEPAALVLSVSSQTNVYAYGASTGSVTLSATGGVSPYTWSIDGTNYQTSPTFSGLAAGNYTFRVKDTNGNVSTKVVTITQPATALALNVSSQSNVTVNGGTNGSVTLVANGGTSPYTYSKDGSTFQSSPIFSGLAAGTYTFYVKDVNGITATKNVTVTEPAVLVLSVSSQTNVYAYGASTGSVTLSATGGVSPYTWSIDGTNYQTSPTFSGLAAGTYTFYVKDTNGNVSTKSVTITQPSAALALNVSSQSNVTVNGGSNGTVTVVANGGTSPYTYSKDGTNFQSSPTFSGLTAATYTFTVKDVNGITATKTVIVTQPDPLVLSVSSQTNVYTYGASTGSVTLDATGGVGPYTWSIDGINYQTSATFSGLPAGSYTFRVKDANGNISTKPVVITQPASALTLTVSAQSNVTVNGGSNGSVTLSSTGGTSPYTWSKDGTNFQSSPTFSGLTAGVYTFSVKDANGVIVTKSVTITQPDALVLSVSSQTNVYAYGASTGSVTLAANGGVGPYTWSIDGTNYQTSPTFSGLAAGTYTFRVKDANGNVSTKVVTITQPASALTLAVSSQSNVTVNGGSNGSVTLVSTGGTSPYTWSIDGTNYQTSPTFSGLAAGTYTFTAKDANGVTVTKSVTVTQPDALVLSVSAQSNVTSYGGANGSVTLAATGGVGPYTWSIDGTNYQTSPTFPGLAAGTYTFRVKDANGNVSTKSVTITQPNPLALTVNAQTNVTCNGTSTGSVTLAATGGTSPYTYSKDAVNYQSSATFSGLAAGTYTFKVKDANGLIESKSVTITQPNAISVSVASQTNVLCYYQTTGSVTLSATGGASSYTYSKDGITYQSSATFSGLTAGTYTFRVKDANGCIVNKDVNVTRPDAPLAATYTTSNVTCNGSSNGSITLSGSGGVAPYTYSKDGGATYQSSATLSGLAAGTYTCKVKDANGCTETKTVTITQPDAIVANLVSKINVNGCSPNTGSVTMSTTGGTAPYTWSKNGTTFQSSATLTGLSAGTYTITVKDANLCVQTNTVTIISEATSVITAVKTGNWNDPSTWDLGRIPTACDDVMIGSNYRITVSSGDSLLARDVQCSSTSRLDVNGILNVRDFNGDDNGATAYIYGHLYACSADLDNQFHAYACANVSLSNCTNKLKPLDLHTTGMMSPLGGSYCSTVEVDFKVDSHNVDLTSLCPANIAIKTLYVTQATVKLDNCNNVVEYVRLNPGGDVIGNTPTWANQAVLSLNRDYTLDASSILWLAGTGNVPKLIDIVGGNINVVTPKTVVTKMQMLGGVVYGGNNLIFANNSHFFRCGGILNSAATMGNNVTVELCSDTSANNPPTVIGGDMPAGGYTGDVIISTNTVLGSNITVPAGRLIVTKTGTLNDSTFKVNAATAVKVDSGGVIITSNPAGLTGTNSLLGSVPVTLDPKSTVIYSGESGTQVISPATYGTLILEDVSMKTIDGTANVVGDFIVSGGPAITTSNCTMNFNGTGTQNIAGLVYNDVSFSGTGNKNITSPATVNSSMNVGAGTTLNTNNHLTLESNNITTAQIGPLVNGADIVGDICWKRFIPGGPSNRRWRFLSNPVQNVTFRWWQNDIHITGPGTGGVPCPWNTTSNAGMIQNSNGFDQNQSGVYSCYTWNEPSATWVTIPRTFDTINPLRAYRTFVRGNRNVEGCLLLTLMPDSVSDVTLKSCGPVVKFTQSIPLTYTPGIGNGWNYVSNPYPCSINWWDPTWVAARGSTINPTIYIWNPVTAQYASWNPFAGGTNGASNIIGTGQSFFIMTTAPTNLVFQETYKLDSGQIGLFGKANSGELQNNLKIGMKGPGGTADEAIVFIQPNATHGFDFMYDAYKMGYSLGGVATQVKGDAARYVFNGIGSITSSDTIILNTYTATTNATYTLTFNGVSTFDQGYQILLRDKYLNTLTNLSANSNYTFSTITGVSASYDQSRFELIFSNVSSLPVTLTDFKAKKRDHKTVLVSWMTASEVNNSHFILEHSTDGRNFSQLEVVKGAINSTETRNYGYTHFSPVDGMNYYRLTQVDLDGEKHYSYVIAINMAEEHTGTVSIFPVPAHDMLNIDCSNTEFSGNIAVKIYDIVGKEMISKQITLGSNGTTSIDVAHLNRGSYFITITSPNGAEQQIKFIKD